MPISPGFLSGTSNNNTAVEKRSLMAGAGVVLYEAADYLANITRSAAIGDIENTVRSIFTMIPNQILDPPRRVSGGEVVEKYGLADRDNFFAGLAAEIILDPLTFIAGVGTLTKGGKATSRIRKATADLTALKRLKDVHPSETVIQQIAEAYAIINKSKKELVGFTGPKRAIATIQPIPFRRASEFQVGSFDRVAELAGKLRILPDARIPQLTERIQSLTIEINRNDELLELAADGSKQAAALTAKIDDLVAVRKGKIGEVGALSRGLIRHPLGASAALKIRAATEGIRKRFSRTAPAGLKFLDSLRDISKSEAALGHFDAVAKSTLIQRRAKELAELAGETMEEFHNRTTRAAEFRHIAKDPDLNPVTVILQEDINKIKKDFRKRIAKEAKTSGIVLNREKLMADFQNDIFKLKAAALGNDLQLKEMAKAWGTLSPEEFSYIRLMTDETDRMIPIARDLHVDIDKLTSSRDMLAFVRRLPTHQALRLKKSQPETYKLIFDEFNTRQKSALKRKLYPLRDIVSINKLIKKDFGVNFDFFDTNIANQYLDRSTQHVRSINKAAAVRAAINQTMIPGKFKNQPNTVKKLYEKVGMDVKKAPDGIVPKEVFDYLTGFDDFITRGDDSELLGTFMRVMDDANNWWRIGLTTLFPKFHHRNWLNNMVVNGIAGDIGLQDYVKTTRLMKDIALDRASPADKELWRELGQFRAIRAGEVQEWAHLINPETKFGRFLDRPLATVMEKVDKNYNRLGREGVDKLAGIPFPAGQAYGRYVEEHARISHYLGKRRAGLSQLESMRSMNKYLFDPIDITEFERKKVRPLFLFYTWSRNNIPLMLNTIIRNPRYAAIYGKITGMGEDEVPTWMKGSFAFKAPVSIFGEDQFINSLGLGIEDLNLFNVQSAQPSGAYIAGLDEVRRGADKFQSLLAPLIQIPLSFVQNRQFFSGRKLSETGSALEIALKLSPGSRFVGTTDRIYDALFDEKSERGVVATMVDMLTGLKVYHSRTSKSESLKRSGRAAGLTTGFEVEVPRARKGTSENEKARALIREVARARAIEQRREQRR